MKREFSKRDEGPMSLSGWLFADLFLALIVVGFSLSWVPKEEAARSTEPPATTTTTTTIPMQPFETTTTVATVYQLSCQEFGIPLNLDEGLDATVTLIRRAISDEILRRGWNPDEVKPGLINLFAGYVETGDIKSDQRGASSRAENLKTQLITKIPDFGRIDIRTSIGRSIAVDTGLGGSTSFSAVSNSSYIMVIYFVYSGPPLSENC
jgi:hypothetical protein